MSAPDGTLDSPRTTGCHAMRVQGRTKDFHAVLPHRIPVPSSSQGVIHAFFSFYFAFISHQTAAH